MDVLKKLGITPKQTIWPGTKSSGLLGSYNPANEQLIAHVYPSSQDDYEAIIARAQKAFLVWRKVPAPKRAELVRCIGIKLRECKDELGTLVSLETGKIKQEGDGEVQEMIDMADFAVGLGRMLYGKTMHSERPEHRMYEHWHPLGVVGVITAFNFPVAVWAWNALVAAVCGNGVIWKPSPKTPLTAIAVQRIAQQTCQELGYPNVFNLLVTDDDTLSRQLVKDTRLPLISFTGSSAVGKQVAQWVAQRLGRSILELSGNNAIIVDETARLDLVVPSVVFGALGTAGQRCTSLRRLFVHRSQQHALIDRLVTAYKQVTIGDPLDSNVLMGPLIDKRAVNHYLDVLEQLKSQGSTFYCKGQELEREGHFVTPTLALAQPHWPIVSEETFGPLLYVIPYDDLDEAIQWHNAVPQGLSSAIFTQSLAHAETFLSAAGSDCGIANVNIGTSGAEIGGAFGGEKATGGGREAGSDAWKSYMRRQTTTINWGGTLPLAQGIQFGADN